MVLPPPEDFSSEIHHMFVNFIWNGRHWKNPHHLKCEYIGDLLNENGKWKDIRDFSIEAVSTSTVRRLTVNLKKAKMFIDHYYPKQARTDAPKDTSFFIGTQKGMMKIPPISRKCVYEHC
jgi:hypothetical protein